MFLVLLLLLVVVVRGCPTSTLLEDRFDVGEDVLVNFLAGQFFSSDDDEEFYVVWGAMEAKLTSGFYLKLDAENVDDFLIKRNRYFEMSGRTPEESDAWSCLVAGTVLPQKVYELDVDDSETRRDWRRWCADAEGRDCDVDVERCRSALVDDGIAR